MKFRTVRQIRQIFLGMLLLAAVFGAVVFYPRILFASDAMICTYLN